jgi:membrane protease YdiL (CAAX protease family)
MPASKLVHANFLPSPEPEPGQDLGATSRADERADPACETPCVLVAARWQPASSPGGGSKTSRPGKLAAGGTRSVTISTRVATEIDTADRCAARTGRRSDGPAGCAVPATTTERERARAVAAPVAWSTQGIALDWGGVYPNSFPPDAEPPPSDLQQPPAPTLAQRVIVLLEVLICSDFPTQLAIGGSLAALGYGPYLNGHLRLSYVVGLSLVDTIVLLGLITLFLHAHGERLRELVTGRRRLLPEGLFGLLLVIPTLAISAGVLIAIQLLAPSLHTVAQNPLQQLLTRPRDAWLFALVVVIAGGIREEVQRAFLLHRFEVWLGGGTVGIVVTSIAFGAGHLIQGVDAALAIGLLGAFWGVIYLRRRSAVGPMVSHAGFDLLQLVQFLIVGR